MKEVKFDEIILIKEFTIIDWSNRIAYELGIRDCVKVVKQAISERIDDRSCFKGLMYEVKSFRETGGSMSSDSYTLTAREDYEQHNGCMIYYHYGFDDWTILSEEDFNYLLQYIRNCLKEETEVNTIKSFK